jgi:hypothetical protein
VLFISPQGEQLKYVLQIHYKASKLSRLWSSDTWAPNCNVLGIKRLLAYGDSKVVIE